MSKTILVTGASRGIGYSTVTHLANGGHKVIATARSKDPLLKLEDRFRENVIAIPGDLTQAAYIPKLQKKINNLNLKLDGMINNAGILINKPFESQTDDDWKVQLDINLIAPARLVRELIPLMNEGSHIVNISSMGGFQGSSKFPGLSAYSVSKGGLSILTECLAVELTDKNISCNCLCLGAVFTEMLKEAFPGFEPPVTADEMGTYIADFTLRGHRFYNGKIIPVSLSDPE